MQALQQHEIFNQLGPLEQQQYALAIMLGAPAAPVSPLVQALLQQHQVQVAQLAQQHQLIIAQLQRQQALAQQRIGQCLNGSFRFRL